MDRERIDECLRVARCSEGLRRQVGTLERSGHADEALPQLARHRLQLLAEAREADHRLDCLDQAIRAITSQKK